MEDRQNNDATTTTPATPKLALSIKKVRTHVRGGVKGDGAGAVSGGPISTSVTGGGASTTMMF